VAARVVATPRVAGTVRTMTNEQKNPGQGPEEGATEEAIALHGNRAAAEKYEQPDDADVVTLPGDTVVAKHPGAGTESDRAND
jgi:hypothetical protein